MNTIGRKKTGQTPARATVQKDLKGMEDVEEPRNAWPSPKEKTEISVNHDKNPSATQAPLPTNPSDPIVLTSGALQLIIDRLIQNGGVHPAPSSEPFVGDGAFAVDFISFNPPKFDGTSDNFDVAEKWLAEIEAIFNFMQCQDDQRVRSAIFLLRGNAYHWWESVKTVQDGAGTPVSWQNFKDMFLDRYYPDFVWNKRELEFLKLRQGNMTMYEYERKFEELSRFSPLLVNTELKMVHRFVFGLRDEIRGEVGACEHTDYASVRRSARLLDQCTPRKDQGCSFNQKRKFQQNY